MILFAGHYGQRGGKKEGARRAMDNLSEFMAASRLLENVTKPKSSKIYAWHGLPLDDKIHKIYKSPQSVDGHRALAADFHLNSWSGSGSSPRGFEIIAHSKDPKSLEYARLLIDHLLGLKLHAPVWDNWFHSRGVKSGGKYDENAFVRKSPTWAITVIIELGFIDDPVLTAMLLGHPVYFETIIKTMYSVWVDNF